MLIGWLSPEGVFHECDYWNHIDLAYNLLNTLAIEPKNDNIPDEELIQRGWIKLYISLFHEYREPFEVKRLLLVVL